MLLPPLIVIFLPALHVRKLSHFPQIFISLRRAQQLGKQFAAKRSGPLLWGERGGRGGRGGGGGGAFSDKAAEFEPTETA
jgi:hypothetical protein